MSLLALILCIVGCMASYYLTFLFWKLDSDNVLIESLYQALSLFFIVASAVMTVVVIFGLCNLGG